MHEVERKGVHNGGVKCARPGRGPKKQSFGQGTRKAFAKVVGTHEGVCAHEGYTPGDANKKAGRKGESLRVKYPKAKKTSTAIT